MDVNSGKSPVAIVNAMPEAFVSYSRISNEVSRRVADGRLRKLATRLYTTNFDDAAADIVRRNLWDVVASYFPGALVADRTAFEFKPAADGSVCLVSPRGTDIELPGVVLRPRRGVGPTEDDPPFMNDQLYLSSRARTFLDNLCNSRARGERLPRTLSRIELEEHLERLMASAGESACNQLRDDARCIAGAIGRTEQFTDLDSIIGTMAGTHGGRLQAATARARARGRPYDAERVRLFENLFETLQENPGRSQPTRTRDGIGHATLAFFEAYFSNYIEGTEFEVREAADIVFGGRIPQHRPSDAHDIFGVWKTVSDHAEMRRLPGSANELIEILRKLHATVLAGRPEMSPGRFKALSNRIGSIEFVASEAVVGTLSRGFEIGRGLDSPFHRAVYTHFLVSEVHPFEDGNGRLARIMMNAELVAADEERIVIPTLFRENYIAAQRALSVGNSALPLMRALDFVRRWTAAMKWGRLEETEARLQACNAFESERVAEEIGVRLLFYEPAEEMANDWAEHGRI